MSRKDVTPHETIERIGHILIEKTKEKLKTAFKKIYILDDEENW